MRSFDIGNLLKGTFEVILKNWLKFFLATGLYLIAIVLGFGGTAVIGAQAPEAGAVFLSLGLLAFIIFAGLGVLYPFIMFGAIRSLRDERWGFFEAIGHCARVAIPVIAITILVTLGVAAGMILLIIPGLILLVRWFVAVPVRIAEPVSVTGAIGRSAELTRGHRWELFGGFIILSILAFLFQMVFGGIVTFGLGAAISPDGLMTEGANIGMTILGTGVLLIGQGIATLLFIVAPAVAYYLLRVEKEGGETQEVANIFA